MLIGKDLMLSLQPALSGEDVSRIHQHSLDVLADIGIDYKTPKALEILEEKGCKVDYKRNWASIPPDLV
jgi:trimethylamine:corrinoid methyltransferase-like protein